MKNYKDIAYKLKLCFENHDISIRMLSNQLDISEPTLRNYLNGNREPNLVTFIQLCNALNVNIYSLFSSDAIQNDFVLNDIEIKFITLLREANLKQLFSIMKNIIEFDQEES